LLGLLIANCIDYSEGLILRWDLCKKPAQYILMDVYAGTDNKSMLLSRF